MSSLDILSTITDPCKVRLQAVLRQGRNHDLYGTAKVLPLGKGPLIRIALEGKSGKDRPSARALDPEGQFSIRLALGSRPSTISMELHAVESDDQALFKPLSIEQEEQSREFFRVQCQCQFEIEIIPAQKGKEKPTPVKGILQDISGGGLMMHTDQYFHPGARLDLQFALEFNQRKVPMLCSATVVRCLAAGIGDKGHYDTAVAFDDLYDEQRDAIVSFCFAKQREQLREKVQVRNFD